MSRAMRASPQEFVRDYLRRLCLIATTSPPGTLLSFYMHPAAPSTARLIVEAFRDSELTARVLRPARLLIQLPEQIVR
jgi:hypothetical protein